MDRSCFYNMNSFEINGICKDNLCDIKYLQCQIILHSETKCNAFQDNMHVSSQNIFKAQQLHLAMFDVKKDAICDE